MNSVGLVESSFIFDSSNLSPIHGIPFMESHQSLTNHSVLCCGQRVYLLRRPTLYLHQTIHRGHDGSQMSSDPYCVISIVFSTLHKSQEFSS